MPTHTILGADGRPVRRWMIHHGGEFVLRRIDGTVVGRGPASSWVEPLPLDVDDTPVPTGLPRVLTADFELTDAGRHVLGLGPILTPAQTRGAVPLDPNHTGPDLETPT